MKAVRWRKPTRKYDYEESMDKFVNGSKIEGENEQYSLEDSVYWSTKNELKKKLLRMQIDLL